MKRQHSRKERFLYWFDSRMAKGTFELIKLLMIVTLIVVLVISGLIIFLGYGEEGAGSVVFESFSTIINAWMPSAEDGEFGYLFLMSLAAMSGLLVTSVLIGIFSTSIEERIIALKKGNSLVVEEDHTVVLNFTIGEYVLLQQLIYYAENDPLTLVVAGSDERDEMEEAIRGNLEIPKNVKIICRTVDIDDPSTLEKLSLSDARSIVISVGDDNTTVKTILAVTRLIDPEECPDLYINAIVKRRRHILPQSYMEEHHVRMLNAGKTVAKVVARASTQPGISEAFEEVFNFEGYDLYEALIPEAAGMTFMELTLRMDPGIPVGVKVGEEWHVNPLDNFVIPEGAKIMIFAEDDDRFSLLEKPYLELWENGQRRTMTPSTAGVVGIIGANDALDGIIAGLPETVEEVILAGIEDENPQAIIEELPLKDNTKISVFGADLSYDEALEHFVSRVDHIILMTPDFENEEESDMETIYKLMRLRDIRTRKKESFSITAELCRQVSRQLVKNDDGTDFIVASDMSSLFLAQLAESTGLYNVFRELLSDEGNELLLKKSSELHVSGHRVMAEIRRRALLEGYIVLGYLPHDSNEIRFDMKLSEAMTIDENDRFVVFGER